MAIAAGSVRQKRSLNEVLKVGLLPLDDVTAEEAEELVAERARSLYANGPTGLAAVTTVAVFVVVLLWPQVKHGYLAAWLVALLAMNTHGAWLLWLSRSRRWSTTDWVKAGRWFEFRNAVAAALWGIGLAGFFCLAAPTGQLVVLTAMVLVTGGFSIGIPSFTTVVRFTGWVLLPTAVVAPLVMDGPIYSVLSFMLVLFFLVCTRFSYNSDKRLSLSVLLRMRNERLARELAQTNARLEEANAAKTRFLAAANHDLRQPMHAISLLVSALRSHVHSPEAQAIVSKVQASVEAMDSLFSAILDISKLDANAVEPKIESFALANMLHNLELHYGPLAAEKGLKFKVVMSRCSVRTDPVLLDRIVGNFVANAIRYTEQGGVLVGVRRKARELEIQVIDTGVGIPRAQQRNVFQEFVQLSNPMHDRSKGLGLGLSIVRRIADVLGHEITVESIPGVGSKFAVRVPVAGDCTVETPPRDAHDAEQALSGAFVVVVDDEEAILYGMEALLRAHGCHVVAGSSGSDVVAKLAEHLRQPDLIVTDFRLSAHETGLDVIRRIRQDQDKDIPALIVTGSQSSDDLQQAGSLGLCVLHKPVPEKQLLGTMAEVMAASHPAPG